MADKILNAFDVWITAQGVKSRTRLRSVDNISMEGVERLRELILEFAIQGKLTSRNSDDERAHDLLKKIQLERESLVKKGVIRKERDFPEVSKSEKPFDLPETWEWVRIDTVGHDWGQKEPKSEFNYIEVSGIDSDKGIINSTELLAAENAPSRARKIVKKGTVIYSTVRPYLKNICVVDREFSPEPIASTAFAVLHPFQSMPGKYFFYYLRSPTFVKYVESVQIGVAYPAINDKQFFGGSVPLPPLAEQHRIVAKVDELMALCDALEQQETHHLKSHQLLVETLLGTLTRAADAKEFQHAWNKLYEHFDDLFTTEDSIDQLKQTILQLAVMGKLVPQNPNDEPASELFKKIEKQETGQKKSRDKKTLPPASVDEIPFLVPKGWSWCRFGEIALIESNLVNPKAYSEYFNIAPDNIEKGTGKLISNRTVRDAKINSPNHLFYKGQIIYSKIRPNLSKAVIAPYDGLCSADMYPVRSLINTEFLLSYILSKSFLIQIEKLDNRIKMPKINQRELSLMLVAVPPLNEQKRIVSKVDDLFALCDRLKERITEAQKVANQMAEGVGAMKESA